MSVKRNLNMYLIQIRCLLYIIFFIFTGAALDCLSIRLCIVCLYMYCHRRTNYQEWRVGIALSGLTPPHFICPALAKKIFLASYVVVLLCSTNENVLFVYNGSIVDHHCLSFLSFIIDKYKLVAHPC